MFSLHEAQAFSPGFFMLKMQTWQAAFRWKLTIVRWKKTLYHQEYRKCDTDTSFVQ